jgi:hypothetical protein
VAWMLLQDGSLRTRRRNRHPRPCPLARRSVRNWAATYWRRSVRGLPQNSRPPAKLSSQTEQYHSGRLGRTQCPSSTNPSGLISSCRLEELTPCAAFFTSSLLLHRGQVGAGACFMGFPLVGSGRGQRALVGFAGHGARQAFHEGEGAWNLVGLEHLAAGDTQAAFVQ